MTNGKKIGGLLLLLAIPIAILLFLQEFGQQHYAIPTDPAEAEGLSAEVPAGSLGQAFQLAPLPVDDQGKPVAADLLSGKETILFPSLSLGSDTARVVLEKLTRIQDVFEQEQKVQILVIAATKVAGELPQVARQYRSQPGFWHFLADTTQTNPIHDRLPSGTSSATLLLIDQQQRVRGYYDGMQEDEIDRLVVETRILLYGVE